jgi:hypothetical protein
MKSRLFAKSYCLLVILCCSMYTGLSQSVSLNGSSQYIGLGNHSSLHLTSFTLEAWIRIEGTGATTSSSTSNGLTNVVPILTKGRSENDGDPAREVNYFLAYNPTNNRLVADFEDNNNGTNHPVTGNTAIPACTWTHVAASFNLLNNTWKLYINGALDQTLNLGATTFTPQSLSNVNASIGSSFNSTGAPEGYFRGRIDEVRIWNIARADNEILTAHNMELSSGTGLVARWGLNEGSGSLAANSISGGAAGALSGSPAWKINFNQVAVEKSYLEFDGTDDYASFGQYLSSGGMTKGTVEFWFKPRTIDGNSQYLFSLVKSGGNFDGEMRCYINENDAATNPNRLIFEIVCTSPDQTHIITSTQQIVAGTWYHAALVWESDVAGSMKMYLDGAQTGSSITPTCGMQITDQQLNIGRNNASATNSYFDGYMDELRIWNSVRTATEIQNNRFAELGTGTDLKSRWGFDEGCGTASVNSIAGSANAVLTNGVAWVSGSGTNQPPNQPSNPSPPDNGGLTVSSTVCTTVSDPNGGTINAKFFGRVKNTNNGGKFSIILLPDTQYYTAEPQGTNGGTNFMFKAQTNWIATNRQALNIAFVGQLGDCTEHGDANEVEWKRVDTSIRTIEDPLLTGLPQGIPYGLSVGNHDQSPIGGGVSASTSFFNQYFGISRYTGRSYYGGHYGSNNDNHFELFSASGVDFIVISMEYDPNPPAAVLDWAASLAQTYSNRKLIVMTHFGINETGSPQPSFGAQGSAIYNKLREYPNFILFVCGHIHQVDGEARRVDTYNGNTVHTIISDYQSRPFGGNGLLRIMEFDPALNKVSVKTYSPYTNTYETDADSQFELDVNLNTTNYTLIGEAPNAASGSSPCVFWPGLLPNTQYEWYAQLSDGESITNGPVWSLTTPANIPIPVPVKLISFTAIPSSSKVELLWSTAFEQDNNHFEIERSPDGNHFSRIGNVNGQGNSVEIRNYSFTDNQPMNGISYYRLKQVDGDGKATYSRIVRVTLERTGNRYIIYPNPASGKEIRVSLDNAASGPVEVQVHGAKGVIHLRRQYTGAGTISLEHQLSPGIYIIKFVTKDYTENQKLIIQ